MSIGRVSKNADGYLVVRQLNGYDKPLHRIIMEEHLGRRLKRTEQIHHKNGVRTDNRLENLQIISRTAHKTLHKAYRNKKKYSIRKCPVCGETFARLKKLMKKTSTCSRSCAMKRRHNGS